MTTKEEIQDLNKNFIEFTSKVDEFIDTFGESLNSIAKRMQEENEMPSGLWKPKKYETYYYIDDFNNICNREFCNTELDNARILIGNCFRTQEEAEKHLEHLKVETQLRDIAARLNKGREIDWRNIDQDKYFLLLEDGRELRTDYEENRKQGGTIYCLNDNFYDVAISEIGEERLKEYLKNG